jgi:hypothetical protein
VSSTERLHGLGINVEGLRLERAQVETSAGWTRVTTTIVLCGGGHEGRGEDVCYEVVDHEHFPDPDLSGIGTFGDVSRRIGQAELWPAEPPEHAANVDYRLWAFESAALDLALRQADLNLGEALGRAYEPVHFAVSGVEDPAGWLEVNESLDFKLDVAMSWDEELMKSYAHTGRIRVLDFKAYYTSAKVDGIDDPATYALVASMFPDAILEDAALNDETLAALANSLGRLSFDAPIHSLADVHALSVCPRFLNIKPSRFGTVERLLACIEWCLDNEVTMYGGGQFELGVGREQIQALASLFYAASANDVAPALYNTATDPRGDLPRTPLPVPDRLVGFSFDSA